jgi:hypothetical protein
MILLVLGAMIMFMVVTFVIMMIRVGLMRLAIVRVSGFAIMVMVVVMGVIVWRGLRRQRRIRGRGLDDLALHPLAIAATARIAMPRTTAIGTVFGFFLGFAMGPLVGFDQGLAIGDRDLVIIGMDFAEGQEAMAVAAVFDEGRLQRRLDPRDLGEIDVAAQLFALGGFEIKFFDAVAAHHHDPGLFRMGGIDQHFVGHFVTHDGGGRAGQLAQWAPPGDATVHLIRG